MWGIRPPATRRGDFLASGDYRYVGCELELFADARRWKRYVRAQLDPYVKGDVLEVGAGIGTNAKLFASAPFSRWWCLEPDRRLAARIASSLPSGGRHRVMAGTIEDLDPSLRFDTILYIDVLEHIPDDAAELEGAGGRLRPGGCLAVVAPAHAGLTSALDRAVGHLRRYTRETLRSAAPAALDCIAIWYLDSLGILASFANRVILRQRLPSATEVRLWDRVLVPCSVVVDRLTGYRLGKSVVGIWRRGVAP